MTAGICCRNSQVSVKTLLCSSNMICTVRIVISKLVIIRSNDNIVFMLTHSRKFLVTISVRNPW